MHTHTINSDPTQTVDVDHFGEPTLRRTPGIATVRIESPGQLVGTLQLAPHGARTGVGPAVTYCTTTWDVAAAAIVSGY